jgi:hypothetical protein
MSNPLTMVFWWDKWDRWDSLRTVRLSDVPPKKREVGQVGQVSHLKNEVGQEVGQMELLRLKGIRGNVPLSHLSHQKTGMLDF